MIGRGCGSALELLRNRRIFVTGGTGFFGRWLLESLTWANDEFGLNAGATVLTRNAAAFAEAMPHLAEAPGFELVEGDVRFLPPALGAAAPFNYVVHMATDTDAAAHRDSIRLFDSIVSGTRGVLDLAAGWGVASVLMTSSGAVYGPQPPGMTHVPETFGGAPDPAAPGAAYGEGKRVAELLGAMYLAERGVPVKIARCFAFVGPHLPLDGHFAIGNFIGDALAGRSIEVSGDGTPVRSYLYAADLTVWLWTILLNGRAGAVFNVGSGESVTIAETARAVAGRVAPALPVRIARESAAEVAPQRYVPSVALAEKDLGLRQTVSLADAIDRTLAWHQASGGA